MKMLFAAVLLFSTTLAHASPDFDLASDTAWTLQGDGHAFIMEHYGSIDIVDPSKGIRGMGEFNTETGDLGIDARNIRSFRMNDWAYFALWSLVNFWPNFLEGMSHASNTN